MLATSLPGYENEPDYTNLHSVSYFTYMPIQNVEQSLVEDSLVSSILESVAANVSLGDTNVAVLGRILGKIEAYLEAGASEYILDTVRYGYKLVFTEPPPKDVRPNNRSALAKPDFLWTELLRLESLGCIKRVDYQPHIVNPCSVVFSKKWRCVLDAGQCLNKYCCKRPTKLADLSCIHQLLRQGDYMTVNDLDSGYWQVPIYPPHQKYLGLSFTHLNGDITYFVWIVIGFLNHQNLLVLLLKK
jgi:hypothetical protein